MDGIRFAQEFENVWQKSAKSLLSYKRWLECPLKHCQQMRWLRQLQMTCFSRLRQWVNDALDIHKKLKHETNTVLD
jgi:hypothetical protein